MGFEFLAICRNDGPNYSIYRMNLDDELRAEMAHSFTIPAEKWQEPEVQRAAFDEAYTLAEKEIFEIKQFVLPPDLLNAVRFPQEYGEFTANTKGIADLKAIVAVYVDGSRTTAIVKNVGKAKKLEPARHLTLLCTGKEYVKQRDPGIIIDDRVAAVYVDGTLLFRSPSAVKQVMSLKAYMKEANDLEIVAFLEKQFETDTEKVLAVTDNWMRKRFAAIMESKLFETQSALDIYETARSFSTELPVELSQDRTKLVLPEGKQDIRMILKFLNEEYYKGALTGKDYQTPSKRPLANDENAFSAAPRKRALSFGS
jgi:hypothetical protein